MTHNSEQTPHILVIDDDPMILTYIEHTLRVHYRVTTVDNSQEALELLHERDFDLIVTDIQMPIFSGFDILTYIREKPETADTPVILVSGMAETKDVIQGLELGASDYITKPFDRKLALARIRTQLMLKDLVDQQKRAVAELERVQQMRDRFFHMASHDLKNPMNNIRLAQYVLREMIGPNEEVTPLLENIDSALNTMSDIIHDFLDNAALQSQALELDIKPVAVEEALWDVVYQFSMTAEKKDIRVTIQDAPGVIAADPERLSQIVSNFISNAIKYSPFSSEVFVWTEPSADTVRICVGDEGPGIPVEERHRLFTEFSKLSTTPTDGEGRTGLGLWIVRQLAEFQDGTVGADFPAEGGSIFWVELPAQREVIAVAEPA